MLEACSGGTTPACTAARKDALDKIASYVDLTYQNPKTQQAGYQEIDRLLNSTSPEAQQAFDLVEAYTEAFKDHGYSDSEAELYARRYVGSIHLIQGVTGAAISQSLVKQFETDVAKPNVKPNVTLPKGTNNGAELDAGSKWGVDKNGEYSFKETGEVVDVKNPNNQFDGKNIYDAKGSISKNTNVPEETGATLIFHENLGGHAIRRHVGKTDAQLLARFDSEPRVLASSTFTDMKTADWAIGNGIAANQDKISNFMAGSDSRIVLNHESSTNIGRVINKGQTKSVDSNKIVIVIDKNPLMPNGYRIQTAYPK